MFIMRAPMAQIKNEEKWRSGDCAFGYSADDAFGLSGRKQDQARRFVRRRRFQVWSFVHGLVSLYVRKGCIILMIPDDATREILYSSFDLFFNQSEKVKNFAIY